MPFTVSQLLARAHKLRNYDQVRQLLAIHNNIKALSQNKPLDAYFAVTDAELKLYEDFLKSEPPIVLFPIAYLALEAVGAVPPALLSDPDSKLVPHTATASSAASATPTHLSALFWDAVSKKDFATTGILLDIHQQLVKITSSHEFTTQEKWTYQHLLGDEKDKQKINAAIKLIESQDEAGPYLLYLAILAENLQLFEKYYDHFWRLHTDDQNLLIDGCKVLFKRSSFEMQTTKTSNFDTLYLIVKFRHLPIIKTSSDQKILDSEQKAAYISETFNTAKLNFDYQDKEGYSLLTVAAIRYFQRDFKLFNFVCDRNQQMPYAPLALALPIATYDPDLKRYIRRHTQVLIESCFKQDIFNVPKRILKDACLDLIGIGDIKNLKKILDTGMVKLTDINNQVFEALTRYFESWRCEQQTAHSLFKLLVDTKNIIFHENPTEEQRRCINAGKKFVGDFDEVSPHRKRVMKERDSKDRDSADDPIELVPLRDRSDEKSINSSNNELDERIKHFTAFSHQVKSELLEDILRNGTEKQLDRFLEAVRKHHNYKVLLCLGSSDSYGIPIVSALKNENKVKKLLMLVPFLQARRLLKFASEYSLTNSIRNILQQHYDQNATLIDLYEAFELKIFNSSVGRQIMLDVFKRLHQEKWADAVARLKEGLESRWIKPLLSETVNTGCEVYFLLKSILYVAPQQASDKKSEQNSQIAKLVTLWAFFKGYCDVRRIDTSAWVSPKSAPSNAAAKGSASTPVSDSKTNRSSDSQSSAEANSSAAVGSYSSPLSSRPESTLRYRTLHNTAASAVARPSPP